MKTLDIADISEGELLAKIDRDRLPRHAAIIMDGNGRWAKQRGLPRLFGHRAGIESVRQAATFGREIGIKYLTLYAFSIENWKRPELEINSLMSLLSEYLKKELAVLMENEIKLLAIGRLENLPVKVRERLNYTIDATKGNDKMSLLLALSYGGRAELTSVAARIASDVKSGKIGLEDITETLFSNYLYTSDIPDPDLLIRTSGEERISNFLLWQLAYTELYFTKTLWPDFRKKDFMLALLDYQKRDRRFGLVKENTDKNG